MRVSPDLGEECTFSTLPLSGPDSTPSQYTKELGHKGSVPTAQTHTSSNATARNTNLNKIQKRKEIIAKEMLTRDNSLHPMQSLTTLLVLVFVRNLF